MRPTLRMARRLAFPPLNEGQKKSLRAALGPMVALSNPLDYNTYVWRDTAAMTAAWVPMAAPHIGFDVADCRLPSHGCGGLGVCN